MTECSNLLLNAEAIFLTVLPVVAVLVLETGRFPTVKYCLISEHHFTELFLPGLDAPHVNEQTEQRAQSFQRQDVNPVT